jgi:Carboxypeptidase regulatory-like domain
MSWIVRTVFWSLVLLSIFSALECSVAVAQQSPSSNVGSSSADSALPGTPEPAEISGSAMTDSQQTAAGMITGTVLDTNRDVLLGARVTVAGQSSSAIRTLESGSNGQFAFAGLPPDIYKLTVTAPGMNSFTSSEISLPAGETRIVSVTLSVFGGATRVTVSGNKEELAEEQVQIAVHQRIGGIVPNFYSSYDWNAPPMEAKQKLKLSFRSVMDPVSLLTTAGTAGVQQYRNTFPGYGGGVEGYGKRFGANLADNVTGVLLSRGVYPSIFHQDPRYFYKGTGSIHSRLLYAISAAVIARGDDGRWKPNYSHVLGNFSAAGISNLYYPPSDRGASLVLFNGLAATGATAFSNVLREFVFKRVTSHAPKAANGD